MVGIFGMFLFPSQAYAYLDPGTGSLILQGIIGGLAVMAVVGKLYWHRLLRFFGIRKANHTDVQKADDPETTHAGISDMKD